MATKGDAVWMSPTGHMNTALRTVNGRLVICPSCLCSSTVVRLMEMARRQYASKFFCRNCGKMFNRGPGRKANQTGELARS